MGDTLASVLKSEPEWSYLPPDVPAAIRLLIQRCLTKDRHQRVSDISAAKFAHRPSGLRARRNDLRRALRRGTPGRDWHACACDRGRPPVDDLRHGCGATGGIDERDDRLPARARQAVDDAQPSDRGRHQRSARTQGPAGSVRAPARRTRLQDDRRWAERGGGIRHLDLPPLGSDRDSPSHVRRKQSLSRVVQRQPAHRISVREGR
jgi:hypothetical protein